MDEIGGDYEADNRRRVSGKAGIRQNTIWTGRRLIDGADCVPEAIEGCRGIFHLKPVVVAFAGACRGGDRRGS
ncbi:MAG: hypothetical protein ACLTSZ_17075 [Lachnospiraceae bacterium]